MVGWQTGRCISMKKERSKRKDKGQNDDASLAIGNNNNTKPEDNDIVAILT